MNSRGASTGVPCAAKATGGAVLSPFLCFNGVLGFAVQMSTVPKPSEAYKLCGIALAQKLAQIVEAVNAPGSDAPLWPAAFQTCLRC